MAWGAVRLVADKRRECGGCAAAGTITDICVYERLLCNTALGQFTVDIFNCQWINYQVELLSMLLHVRSSSMLITSSYWLIRYVWRRRWSPSVHLATGYRTPSIPPMGSPATPTPPLRSPLSCVQQLPSHGKPQCRSDVRPNTTKQGFCRSSAMPIRRQPPYCSTRYSHVTINVADSGVVTVNRVTVPRYTLNTPGAIAHASGKHNGRFHPISPASHCPC